MEEITDKPHPSKSKLHFSLPCFGFSSKLARTKPPARIRRRTGHRSRLLSCLTFGLRKSAAAVKTVPVDAAVSETTDFLSNSKAPSTNRIHGELQEKPRIGESENESSQTRLLGTESSQPGSLQEKFPSASQNAAFLHSAVSLGANPNPTRRESGLKPSTISAVRLNDLDSEFEYSRKRFDSVIGISVIMVTLVAMLVWGRLCAILCAAALFYIGRRLRSEVEPDGGSDERESRRSSFRSDVRKEVSGSAM